jgi:Mrp family chromosome partitioning ATPase
VLYDTPSALAFTDALNLARAVDAAFLCVRALEQTSGAERRLVELLEQANVAVLGSVLSDVPASVLDSYENYLTYYPTDSSSAPPSAPVDRPAVNGPAQTWVQDLGTVGGRAFKKELGANGANGPA